MAQKGALDRAYKAMQKGRYDRALKKLSEAQHYKTPSPAMAAEISFLRAQCYDRSGRPCEAIGAYSYTIDHFPSTTYSFQAQERLRILKLTPRAEVLQYGVCNRVKEGKELGEVPSSRSFEFGSQTNRVPAVLGMGFGIAWVASGLPENQDVTIRTVYVHPAMLTPEGDTLYDKKRDTLAHTSGEGMISFQSAYLFDHPHELIKGDWTIQIWYSGQKLVERTFTVFDPLDAKQSLRAKKS